MDWVRNTGQKFILFTVIHKLINTNWWANPKNIHDWGILSQKNKLFGVFSLQFTCCLLTPVSDMFGLEVSPLQAWTVAKYYLDYLQYVRMRHIHESSQCSVVRTTPFWVKTSAVRCAAGLKIEKTSSTLPKTYCLHVTHQTMKKKPVIFFLLPRRADSKRRDLWMEMVNCGAWPVNSVCLWQRLNHRLIIDVTE